MLTILITQPEYIKGNSVLEKFLREENQKPIWQIIPVEPEEEVLLATIRENRARLAIIGMKSYSERVYQALSENAPNPDKEPAVLCRFGVGMDNVRYDWAEKWNIQLGNTPGVLNHSVAEHTIWLLGAAAKRFGTAWESFKNGLFLPSTGMELNGKKLLIVGFGGIGRETAKIAHFGLGMSVTAFGRRPLEMLAEEENTPPENFLFSHGITHYSNSLEELNGKLIPEADAICMLLSSTPETYHFLGAERFAKMKRTVLLVNTSRGAVVSETDLYDFLQENPDAQGALDVFEAEPYQPQNAEKDLRTLKNIFLTAHHGSSTWDANCAIARSALETTQKLAFRS